MRQLPETRFGLSLATVSAAIHTGSVFSREVLDHFEHPRNAGSLEDAQARIEVANPVCGDVLELTANAANGRISKVRFRAKGCVTSMACASVLTEMISNKTRAEMATITPEGISSSLGELPPATFHGAQLAADALAELLATLRF